MDFLDVLTPIYVDYMDDIPLNINCGYSGQFRDLNRTEGVVSSNRFHPFLRLASTQTFFSKCGDSEKIVICYLP